MKRYPFSPAVLAALPEELAELFRNLEMTLLDEICTRLNLKEQFNEVTIQDIRALRSHGIELDEIKKAISKTTGIGEKKLDELLDDVVTRNQQYYEELITIADVTKPDVLVEAATIKAIKDQCQREFGNITRSMGFLVDNGRTMLEPAKAYQWALDNAEMQIQSGAISYNQAISNAIKQLVDSGIKTVGYESGHIDRIDTAARRAVMTGINQLNRKFTEQSMDFLETDLVQVEAHIGARNIDGPNGWENHEKWQGGIYRWSVYTRRYPNASKEEYKDFERTCGYGDVTGILGANCEHTYGPFVEGVMEPTYTPEQLNAMKAENNKVIYDGKEYDGYQKTQMQRRLENTIKKQKELANAYKAAGLTEDAQTAQIRLNRLNTKYKEFSKAAGLPEQRERMKVTYTDDKSVAAAERLKVQRAAEAPIRESILNGEYSLEINVDKQARHMEGTALTGRSVVTVPMEELQEIIKANAGSGKINLTKDNLAWKHTEIIAAGKEIGYTVNANGEKKIAHSLKIHYSGTGTHAVPFSGRWKK